RSGIGPLVASPEGRTLLTASCEEIVAVARAEAVPLQADAVDRVVAQAATLPPQWRSSMARDLEEGRRVEVDALSGAVVRRGVKLGIPTMTPLRQWYVDNLRGDLKGTVAAANSRTGAVYPPGSVIQLVPTEVMVKRDKGFNVATRDWEFFELDVSKDGTQVRKRGFADVVNRFGGNCFACHSAARPEWDLVCESDHGCRPIPVTRAMIAALQRTD